MAEQESQILKQDLEISEPESDMKFEELKKIWEEKVPQPNEKPVREPVPEHSVEESPENRIISKVDLDLIFKKIIAQGERSRRDVKILKMSLAGISNKEIEKEINEEFEGSLKVEARFIHSIITALDERIYKEYEYLMTTQHHRADKAEEIRRKHEQWAKEGFELMEQARATLGVAPERRKNKLTEPLKRDAVLAKNPGYKVVPDQPQSRINKILKFFRLK